MRIILADDVTLRRLKLGLLNESMNSLFLVFPLFVSVYVIFDFRFWKEKKEFDNCSNDMLNRVATLYQLLVNINIKGLLKQNLIKVYVISILKHYQSVYVLGLMKTLMPQKVKGILKMMCKMQTMLTIASLLLCLLFVFKGHCGFWSPC